MKKLIIIIAIIVVAGVGYYALSPLFSNVVVDDALPEGIDDTSEAIPSDTGDSSPEMNEEKQTPEPEGDMPETQSEGSEEEFSPVHGTAGHPASGKVRVLQTANGTVIRYEDFKTINGPNLHVYLAKDLNADEFVDIGAIKGTEGNINYNVPEGIDVNEYRYVMYWCVPFGVLFNYAEL